jgi:hypothetical protein
MRRTRHACERGIRVFDIKSKKAVVKSDTKPRGNRSCGCTRLYVEFAGLAICIRAPWGNAKYNELCVTKVKFVTNDTCFFRT